MGAIADEPQRLASLRVRTVVDEDAVSRIPLTAKQLRVETPTVGRRQWRDTGGIGDRWDKVGEIDDRLADSPRREVSVRDGCSYDQTNEGK